MEQNHPEVFFFFFCIWPVNIKYKQNEPELKYKHDRDSSKPCRQKNHKAESASLNQVQQQLDSFHSHVSTVVHVIICKIANEDVLSWSISSLGSSAFCEIVCWGCC